MQIDHKHTLNFENIFCVLKITNVVKPHIFEVMSNELNIAWICTGVNYALKLITEL